MLSRRLALAGPLLFGLPRISDAQNRRDDPESELVLLAADAGADSVRTANDMAARFGGAEVRLRAESTPGVLFTAAHLADRPAAVGGILPSVALAYMSRSGLPASVVYALRFIARLGVSEFHVLASQRMAALSDVGGQKVNLGPQGGTTHATATVLLDRMAMRVDPVYLDHDQALAAVLRGEIAAMMLVAPAPAKLFLSVNLSDHVHFLPVGDLGGQPNGLLPAQILPEDYPQLGGGQPGRGRAVGTLGVPMVLACYNWSSATPMFAGLARLCDLLVEHGSGLPGFDMAAEVSGWERFPPVADWLARGRAGTVQDVALGRRRVPAAGSGGGAGPAATPRTSEEQKERLFQQFLNWRRVQGQ
nr:TAXI family TRAP transporter solute-binding subunit [uncultured Rhodopila sp.]